MLHVPGIVVRRRALDPDVGFMQKTQNMRNVIIPVNLEDSLNGPCHQSGRMRMYQKTERNIKNDNNTQVRIFGSYEKSPKVRATTVNFSGQGKTRTKKKKNIVADESEEVV